MSEHITYVANGGQTYQPCQDNVKVPFASYEKPAKPNPLLPELELNQDAIDKGYALPSQKQHFLPGVTAEMMDWTGFGQIWRKVITCGRRVPIRNLPGSKLRWSMEWKLLCI